MLTNWQALVWYFVAMAYLAALVSAFVHPVSSNQQTRHSTCASQLRMAAAASDFRKPPTGLGSWQLRFDVEGDQCSMFVVLFDDGTGTSLYSGFVVHALAWYRYRHSYGARRCYVQYDTILCYMSHYVLCTLCRLIIFDRRRVVYPLTISRIAQEIC
jgi:hypothetical protein